MNKSNRVEIDSTTSQLLERVRTNVQNKSYTAFSSSERELLRLHYISELPTWCRKSNLNKPLYLPSGLMLCRAWSRVVIGDCGAYIEINDTDIVSENVKPRWPGEPAYPVKYLWYTSVSRQDAAKIYLQKRTVTYADYKPDFWYVSPSDVSIASQLEQS